MPKISISDLSSPESDSFMGDLTDKEFTNVSGGLFGLLVIAACIIIHSCED
jgi:hypothetical protein